MSPDLLPALDPTPIPGPAWLFSALLVLTFVLHALFLNLALGGTLLAAAGHLLARGRVEDPRMQLSRRLTAVNTYGISFAITTGVAPLLFVQVLYQRTFYGATILVGAAWFLMLVLLAGGYYAAYAYKLRGAPARGHGGAVWLLTAAVAFLVIAAIHVAVHLVHVQPGIWPAVAERPWSVLADPVYWPRLAHFLLAAVGMSAVVAAAWAVREARKGREVASNAAIARFLWPWVVATTVLEVLAGLVLLFVLPRPVLSGLATGEVAGFLPLAASIVFALGLLVLVALARDPVESPRLVAAVVAALGALIVTMAIARHQVRDLYLQPWTAAPAPQTVPQWGNFALFALLLVAALATVGWMVRRVAAAAPRVS